MSSESGKDNASVVDSSATVWKCGKRNSDDRESPSCKGNDDEFYASFRRRIHDKVDNVSLNKRVKLHSARYFVIKSLNHHNLQLSVQKGIWATQVMNEPILEEAYSNSSKVILIFSVNMSGCFQGYAQMISTIGWRRDNIWSQVSGKITPWGRSFRVKWLRLGDLSFQKTVHLKNPLNEYKPVKISRDCQELTEDIGQALCELIDCESNAGGSTSAFDENCNYDITPQIVPYACSMNYWPFMLQQHMESDSPLLSTLTDDDLLEMTYEEYLEAHNRSMKQFHFHRSRPSYPMQNISGSGNSDDVDPKSLQDKFNCGERENE